ncbi:hypothetical protein Hypma_012086, partial [Hypsizygus marmoreus]
MDPFAIPAHFQEDLLPSPTCSISEFLQFPFPPQARSNSDSQYWSADVPVTLDVERLKLLEVPCRASLEQISHQIYQSHKLNQAASIQYLHVPTSCGRELFPLWVVTFWCEVSRLRQYVKEPWERAQLWLEKKGSMYRKPEMRRVCEEAHAALRILPWAGNTFGFTDNEPVTRLAEYLSDVWLSTVHVDQQLDLLRRDVLRSGTDLKCEIVNLAFFVKVLELYRDRNRVPYTADQRGARHVWAVGEELAKDVRSRICGIVNVEESHWVAVAIEVLDLIVWYGDARGGSNSEVCEALEWWICQHVKKEFRHKPLPITRQRDSHSCSVLALNATGYFCLPGKVHLLEPSDTAYERIACFARVVKRDLDNRPIVPDVPFGLTSTFESVPVGSHRFVFTPVLVPIMDDAYTIDHIDTEPITNPPNTTAVASEHPRGQASAPTTAFAMSSTSEEIPQGGFIHPASQPQKISHYFQVTTAAERIATDRARAREEWRENIENDREKTEAADVKGKKRKRELTTARVQAYRERKVADEKVMGIRDEDGKIVKVKKVRTMSMRLNKCPLHLMNALQSLCLVAEASVKSLFNVAEASRPNRSFKEGVRQNRTEPGRPREKSYKEAVLTNWMSPMVWSMIDRAAQRVGHQMQPTMIVKELKRTDPVLFEALVPQTLGGWINRDGDRPIWSARTLERVAKGNKPGGITTRVGVLVKYPEVTTEILKFLQGLRDASVALTLNTIRGLLIAHLEHRTPQIFKDPSPDGSLFRCSESFVAKFIARSLGWSIRRSTCAGRKIPVNAEEILLQAFLRMAYVIKDHRIPSELIANSDQTQMTLAQGCHMTYAKTGSTQVSTVGSEEKRAITVMVTLTNDGIILPFQTIHKGSTKGSLPSQKAPYMTESLLARFLFESSMTKTYWSTQATMRRFVDVILAPHFEAVKKRLDLPHAQCSIWFIDCWSVHRSDEFLSWIAVSHDTIIVLFVPACLTGLMQPCDVGFQRIFKHSLKVSAHDDVVQEVLQQLASGTAVDDVIINTTLGVLRDRTVKWVWKAFAALNKPEVIKKAWSMCKAGKFNLSYESLISLEALQALRDLPVTDPKFFAELIAPRSRQPPTLSSEEADLEDLEEDSLNVFGDDSEVPMGTVLQVQGEPVRLEVKSDVADADDRDYIPEDGGGLVSNADAETTFVECIGNRVVDATPQGRGLRKKRKNVMYSAQ